MANIDFGIPRYVRSKRKHRRYIGMRTIGSFRGVILYRKDYPFTKRELKSWEEHYDEKLKQVKMYNEFRRRIEYVLIRRR